MERKQTKTKRNYDMILGSIITQIINCQSNKRRKIDLTSIQYTKPLYHISRRLNLPKSTLQAFELKTGLGKIGGKKLLYGIAANENEILLKFFQVFLFIL